MCDFSLIHFSSLNIVSRCLHGWKKNILWGAEFKKVFIIHQVKINDKQSFHLCSFIKIKACRMREIYTPSGSLPFWSILEAWLIELFRGKTMQIFIQIKCGCRWFDCFLPPAWRLTNHQNQTPATIVTIKLPWRAWRKVKTGGLCVRQMAQRGKHRSQICITFLCWKEHFNGLQKNWKCIFVTGGWLTCR